MTVIHAPTDEDVAFVQRVASKISLGDAGDYNVSLQLPFLGGDYLVGAKHWAIRPRYVGWINTELKDKGSLVAIVQADPEMITGIGSHLRRHPMIMGFLAGLEEGTSSPFKTTQIIYENPEAGVKYNRTLPRAAIDIAVCSGAIFGSKTPDELVDLEKRLKGMMFTGRPHSFEEECHALFNAAVRKLRNPLSRQRKEERRETFAKAMFETVLSGAVHTMHERYLR